VSVKQYSPKNMQYISPFSLLEPLGVQELNSGNISLAKKMLLAELELTGSNTISINSQELTKNDIILLIDGLQPKGSVNYHKVVAADVALRNFLEKGVLEKGTRFKREVFFCDPEFIEWLSPYYFTSFSKLSAECISAKLDEKWYSLLSNPLLMNAIWAEKAWGIIDQLVQKDLRILQNFTPKKKLKAKYRLEPLVGIRYVAMLQLLPDETFLTFKDEYAYLMMQYSIHIYNTKDKQAAFPIISRALSLAVSNEMQKVIESTRFGLLRNYNTWLKGGQDRLARKIALGGVLIFIIYTFGMSWSESSEHDNKQNNNGDTTYKTLPAAPSKTLNIADSLKSALPRLKSNDTAKNRSR
jgi:hypothetical protein